MTYKSRTERMFGSSANAFVRALGARTSRVAPTSLLVRRRSPLVPTHTTDDEHQSDTPSDDSDEASVSGEVGVPTA